ncbi:MAG: hypothetical protein NC328_06500 [Muribaculum sp.]|nr:hypothetical protein [Muribaculum sp.]
MLIDPDKHSQEEDWYESVPEPQPEKPRKPREPELKPDDPKYWEQEESEWSHITPRRHRKLYLWLALAAVVIAILWTAWVHWFSPAVEGARSYGYVEQIQKDNMYMYSTYEGVMIPYRDLMDSTRVYREDFHFTAANETVAVALKKLEGSGFPARIEYNVYRAVVPWRGKTKYIVTKADTADASKLLPPDVRPAYEPPSPSGKK